LLQLHTCNGIPSHLEHLRNHLSSSHVELPPSAGKGALRCLSPRPLHVPTSVKSRIIQCSLPSTLRPQASLANEAIALPRPLVQTPRLIPIILISTIPRTRRLMLISTRSHTRRRTQRSPRLSQSLIPNIRTHIPLKLILMTLHLGSFILVLLFLS